MSIDLEMFDQADVALIANALNIAAGVWAKDAHALDKSDPRSAPALLAGTLSGYAERAQELSADIAISQLFIR